jgi:hypothetical protein
MENEFETTLKKRMVNLLALHNPNEAIRTFMASLTKEEIEVYSDAFDMMLTKVLVNEGAVDDMTLEVTTAGLILYG